MVPGGASSRSREIVSFDIDPVLLQMICRSNRLYAPQSSGYQARIAADGVELLTPAKQRIAHNETSERRLASNPARDRERLLQPQRPDAAVERTLREARLELQRHEGELRVERGSVVVVAPSFAAPSSVAAWQGQSLREACEVLFAGEALIVEAMKGKSGIVDVTTLPDTLIGPTGAAL
jgi:hypothetical protein